MTEEIEVQEEEQEAGNGPLFTGLRRALLAGIGALAMAQDEMDEFVGKLVERGEIAEKDGRKLVQELRDRRRERVHGAEESVEAKVQKLLDRMHVPTKKDMEDLSAKISMLADKVDELLAEK